MNDHRKYKINSYLFCALGYDQRKGSLEARISDHWPAKLEYAGEVKRFGETLAVYTFLRRRQKHFVGIDAKGIPALLPEAETLTELQTIFRGMQWMASRMPINSDVVVLEEGLPSGIERRLAFERLAGQAPGAQNGSRMIFGKYLRRGGHYVAVVEVAKASQQWKPHEYSHPKYGYLLEANEVPVRGELWICSDLFPCQAGRFPQNVELSMAFAVGRVLESGEIAAESNR